ncbi:hypothetical protein [Actinotalea sp. K2]|uniref:variant leucine-rich repeat-containing protein n=1 Tax=Actinotalea sp. K2 TaxID=2939438 RepID=UPI002017C567|nr:hypothetical protein [Actinotalea sp. K2]MCL3860599.1 hypothetical protein [Actinotalea sp. K2]
MSPETFTAQQAADPATPAQVLADIAEQRPDLRPAVASNPSAYPDLLAWLGSLRDAAVDGALQARSRRESLGIGLPVAAAPVWVPGAESLSPVQGEAPGTPLGGDPGTPVAPYGGYVAAPAPAWSSPEHGGPAGSWAGQSGHGGPPVASGGGSRRTVLVVVGVLAVVLVLAVLAVVGVVRLIASAMPGTSYGDDPALDALWDACADEEWQACDDLFLESPLGSEYERFGDTCGDRTGGGPSCSEQMAGPAPTSTDVDAYGDDPDLDVLWDACAAGDGQACDDLYLEAPLGSQYEDFGDTCGGTSDGSSFCAGSADAGGTSSEGTADGYGDDPVLDVLWDACAAGDGQACDDLYFDSPWGSQYEEFGDTCGGREEGGTMCAP